MSSSVRLLSESVPELAAVGVVVFLVVYLYAGDFERYSIFTVGVFQRVTHEPAALNGHDCREHWCDVDDVDGERRMWFKQIVLLGVPIASYGGGEAYYCDEHAHVGIQTGEFEESRSVSDSVLWAMVWVAEKFATNVETPDQSEFGSVQDDFTANVSTAMSLFPIAFVIILAAAVIKLMGAGR